MIKLSRIEQLQQRQREMRRELLHCHDAILRNIYKSHILHLDTEIVKLSLK